MRTLQCLALLLFLTSANAAEPSKDAGVGLILGVDGNAIVVKEIVPDSPASAAKSIHAGDQIVAVAQEHESSVKVQPGNLEQAVHLIRGSKGSTVRLTIIPAGEDESRARDVSFTRGVLKALAAWGDGILLTKGTEAPDIQMRVIDTQSSERLSNFADKIVVLEFWATWCGPCQGTMADLQRYSRKYADWKDKVVLIAASVDDTADVAAGHLKRKGWDETHNVWVGVPARKAYHVNGLPTVYVIDRQGKIEATNPKDIPDAVNGLLHRDETERASGPGLDGREITVYVFCSWGYKEGMRLIYKPVSVGKKFTFDGGSEMKLRGRVELRNGEVIANLAAQGAAQGGTFNGPVTMGSPFQSTIWSGSRRSNNDLAPFWFGISTNSDASPIVDQVNAFWDEWSKTTAAEPEAALPRGRAEQHQ